MAHAPAGSAPGLPLQAIVRAEDNAAWLDNAARLVGHRPDAVAAVSDGFGPVLAVLMSSVSALVSLTDRTGVAGASFVVLGCYSALLVGAGAAVGLLARTTSGVRPNARAAIAWAAAAAIVTATCVLFAWDYGFLSASLFVVTALTATALTGTAAVRPRSRGQLLVWCVVVMTAWAVCASWLGAVPLGAGLVVWACWALYPGVRDGRLAARHVLPVVALLAVALISLVAQWQRVVTPAGGGARLIEFDGYTPLASVALVALTLTALGWAVLHRRSSPGAAVSVIASTILLLYTASVAAVSIVTGTGLAYAAIKLAFLACSVCLVLCLVVVCTAPTPDRRPVLTSALSAAALVLAIVWVTPSLGAAAMSGWPRGSEPDWWAAVGDASANGRVVCLLGDEAEETDESWYRSYLCNRWWWSASGADGDAARRWRTSAFGTTQEDLVLADLRLYGAPRTVVVIGPGGMGRLGPEVEALLISSGARVVRV